MIVGYEILVLVNLLSSVVVGVKDGIGTAVGDELDSL